jgi:parallel beta-helix repeat protein
MWLRFIWKVFLFSLIFSSLSLIAAEVKTHDSSIVVPDDYHTIQDAINHASSGDTIIVRPGIYRECIKIDKSLTIIGNGSNSTIIEGTGLGHTVEISKGVVNVTLKGFTINTTLPSSWAGIYVRGLYNSISENIIYNHKFGVKLYDSTGNILRNNLMQGNQYNLYVWGVSLSHFMHDIDTSNLVNRKPVYYLINKRNLTVPFDAGYVAIINSTDVVVANLNLTHNLSAILLAHSNRIIIYNVTGRQNERGIYLICSSNNRIINNTLFENIWSGVTLIASTNNLVSGNIIYNQPYGISLSHTDTVIPNLYSNDNKIKSNLIVNNTYGITFDKASNNLIVENTLKNNTYAITLDNSSNNLFYHNNFLENLFVHIKFSYNLWNKDEEGNFWGDYFGADVDRDGIGDTPHVLNAENIDNYPLMGIFSSFSILPKQSVNVISNSTINDLQYFQSNKTIQVYVSNMTTNQNYGFLRICTSFTFINVITITVKVDNEQQTLIQSITDYQNMVVNDNGTHKWIYFTYPFPSSQKISIPAESPSLLALSFFLFLIILIGTVTKKKLGC